mgnify:CR=1 FL=1
MTDSSIFAQKISPFHQAGGVLVLVSLILIVYKGVMGDSFNPVFPWEIAFSGALFYALVNCMLSFSYLNQNKYWLMSIASYVILAVCFFGLAYWVSGITIDEAGAFRWMFLVFTFAYILLLSIVRAMRKIVGFVQDQDAALRGESEN